MRFASVQNKTKAKSIITLRDKNTPCPFATCLKKCRALTARLTLENVRLEQIFKRMHVHDYLQVFNLFEALFTLLTLSRFG